MKQTIKKKNDVLIIQLDTHIHNLNAVKVIEKKLEFQKKMWNKNYRTINGTNQN